MTLSNTVHTPHSPFWQVSRRPNGNSLWMTISHHRAEAPAAASHIITCKKVNDSKQLTARKRWSSLGRWQPSSPPKGAGSGGQWSRACNYDSIQWLSRQRTSSFEGRDRVPLLPLLESSRLAPTISPGVSSGLSPLRISWLPGPERSPKFFAGVALRCVVRCSVYQKAEFKRYKICIQIATHSPGSAGSTRVGGRELVSHSAAVWWQRTDRVCTCGPP